MDKNISAEITMIEFNPNSGAHLSALLFGGEFEDEIEVPIIDTNGEFVLYKSGQKAGQIKYKKEIKVIKFKGLGLKPLSEWKTKKEGVFQVNEGVLELLSKVDNHCTCREICKLILEIRGLKKQISTYYDATLEYIDENGFVHASFSHCATDTGRLGCSKPNIQNQPDKAESKVKQHFQTRYSPNGKILQADYSQIEPRTHAQLSGDKQLIQDINDNIDTYCKYLSVNTKLSYEEIKQKVKESDHEWIEKRKQAKTVVLADRYGAGTTKLVQQSGLSYNQVKELQNVTQVLYPRYAMYNKFLHDKAHKEGEYTSFTGRTYKFDSSTYIDNKAKNYMYQGTAFDIYSAMLGKFWREKALYNRNKYLMINTIHDSLMLDCREEYLEEAKKDLKTLERVKLMCYNSFDYDWIVPIKVDISEGKTWYDL